MVAAEDEFKEQDGNHLPWERLVEHTAEERVINTALAALPAKDELLVGASAVQAAAEAVAHYLVGGGSVLNDKPSRRLEVTRAGVAAILEQQLHDQPVTEEQLSAAAEQIFRSTNMGWPALMQEVELAADEQLASSAAGLPLLAKQLCVYDHIASKVQELLLYGVERGASAFYAEYYIRMPLHLVTSFEKLSAADQLEVRSRIETVAVEVAQVLNPASMFTAAAPEAAVAREVAALLMSKLFLPPAVLK
jgi:hypothetical protein